MSRLTLPQRVRIESALSEAVALTHLIIEAQSVTAPTRYFTEDVQV